jgi:hypothetical protein
VLAATKAVEGPGCQKLCKLATSESQLAWAGTGRFDSKCGRINDSGYRDQNLIAKNINYYLINKTPGFCRQGAKRSNVS